MHDRFVASALQAKQRETGWDVDARLLLYADAIKRTEMLTQKSALTAQQPPPLDSKQTSSDPSVADSLNCQDGMPKGLHIKTRCKLSSYTKETMASSCYHHHFPGAVERAP